LKIAQTLDDLNNSLARRLREKCERVILNVKIWWWILTHKEVK